MGSINDYLHKTAEFSARAECATDPEMRAEFENLFRTYLRLAVQKRPRPNPDAGVVHSPKYFA